jgi:5-formyltetrahydrofolate cyclo-ligase
VPKKTLRHQLLQQRQSLTPEVWQAHSQAICDRLANSPQFRSAQTILAYHSHRQEPSLNDLFNHTDKYWGLPRCVGKDLCWHAWKPSQPLITGRYDLLEPDPELPQLAAADVDLILMPAVAIDRRGYRLGYGGGYYDRLRADPLWRKIPTIGIVFNFAYLATLPIDPWDVPLDAVCTELGIRG